MKLRNKTTIKDHFSVIQDPRIERTKRHLLIEDNNRNVLVLFVVIVEVNKRHLFKISCK